MRFFLSDRAGMIHADGEGCYDRSKLIDKLDWIPGAERSRPAPPAFAGPPPTTCPPTAAPGG